jgi:hypothetical protein
MAPPTADEVARRLIILKYQVVQLLATPPALRRSLLAWSKEQQEKIRVDLKLAADQLISSLRKLGLWDFMTEAEVAIYSSHPLDLTAAQILEISWRMESAMVLMWALRMVPVIPPFDEQVNTNLLEKIPHENIAAFILNATLLPQETIEAQRSLAELWHWRSRTRQLIEENRPFSTEIAQFKSYDEIVRFSAKAAHERDSVLIIDEDFGALGKAYCDLTDEEWSSVRSIALERHRALNWLCGHAPDNNWDETPTET